MTDRERPGAGDLEPVRARSTACHCGRTVEPRSPDPWEGRMDDYCYDCASNRCDCYPDECPVKYPQGSSAARGRAMSCSRERKLLEFDRGIEARLIAGTYTGADVDHLMESNEVLAAELREAREFVAHTLDYYGDRMPSQWKAHARAVLSDG